MLNEQFFEFQTSFVQYIETGTLPVDFDSVEKLQLHINAFTESQRHNLYAAARETQRMSSWSEIGPVLDLIPRAMGESIVCAAIIGKTVYASTENSSAAIGSAATAGCLWMYRRCTNKKSAVKAEYDARENRLLEFNLPKHAPLREEVQEEMIRTTTKQDSKRPLRSLADMKKAKMK